MAKPWTASGIVAAFIAACSTGASSLGQSADAGAGESRSTDAGGPECADCGATDAIVDAPMRPLPCDPPPPAGLVIVHAAPGVPAVRICFGTVGSGKTTIVPLHPLPDVPSTSLPVPAIGPYPAVTAGTPGIYPGAIGAFPTPADLSAIDLVPFLVLASSVANDVNDDGGAGVNTVDGGAEESCTTLLGSDGTGGRLVLNQDYWALPILPAGTLLDCSAYLLSITGCLQGAAVAGAATCGPGYDGGSTPRISVTQLDTTTVPDRGIGVQFAHRSVSLESMPVVVDGGAVHAPASRGVKAYLFGAGDAAVPVVDGVSAGPVFFSASGLTAPAEVVSIDVGDPSAAFGVVVQPVDGGAPNLRAPFPVGDVIALRLATIQLLSAWSATIWSPPSGFQSGQSYTFVVVGDPAQQPLMVPNPDGGAAPVSNALYDGRGLHLVAFPNVFIPR